MRKSFLKFAEPDVDEREIEQVASVIRTGWLTTGAKTREFESAFAAFVGARHAVAVRPEYAAGGIGARLVEDFSEGMRRRQVGRYCLTTDRDGNDRVNAFYQRLGFSVSRTYRTSEGRWMNGYVKELEGKNE